MRTKTISGWLWAAGAALLVACGGNGGGMTTPTDGGPGGNSNALVGRWVYQGCAGLEGTDCAFVYEFAADGRYTNRTYFVKNADTTTGFAGCTINIEAGGYTWSATASTLSVEQSEPYSLITRTGCLDPADDAPTPFANPDFAPASYTLSAQPYSVNGDQLTIGAGADAAVLTRQE